MLATPRWYPGFIVGTIFLTLALVWAPAGLGLAALEAADEPRSRSTGAAAVIVLLAVVLGRAQEVQYSKNHYTRTTLFLQDGGPQKAFEFAHSQQDQRIGIAGSGEIFFGQYGYLRRQPLQRVQYIGVPGPDGTYRLATTCRQFRASINAGDYDYLIISQFTQDVADSPYWYPIYAWIKDDPALELVLAGARDHPPARRRLQGQRQAGSRRVLAARALRGS